MTGMRGLRETLDAIVELERKVPDSAPEEERQAMYVQRQKLLLEAIGWAGYEDIPVGFRIDPAEPEWPCVYFELPTGQVSWHMPQHPRAWDGHTTLEKWTRIASWAQ
jgi:hypothetical protein